MDKRKQINLLKRKILLREQTLELSYIYEKDFQKKLGIRGLQEFRDEQLDEILRLKEQIKILEGN
jgi:hypothetical protein